MLGLPRTRQDGHSPALAGRPGDPRLIDTYGRVATDLRVSLTDKCSLRCGYCMPPEGLDWMPTEQVLTDDELIRLITLAVDDLGVDEVRFTGGEPLLRRGLERIIEATAQLKTAAGRAPVTALTTNGVGLDKRAARLKSAGLARINVSLDTLDPERFHEITRRDRHADVLAGLEAAAAAGLGPIKINTVLLPGVNDDEAVPLVRWAVSHGYELRFIEQMPLDAQGAWERGSMVTADDIQKALATEFDLVPTDPRARGASPAQTWRVRHGDHEGTVGIIASVTRPFCGDCDRTRLTADGQIRNCLFARDETDLRALLRSGADDAKIADLWRAAMWGKAAGHGINDTSFIQPDRPMSAIGG
ncbi:GTP 3',8-cyclase MoaA [Kineosporia succinea]